MSYPIRGNPWTTEELTLMQQLLKDGLTAGEVAAQLPGERTRNSVIGKANRLKMRLNPNKGGCGHRKTRRWWTIEDDALLRARYPTSTVLSIQADLNRTRQQIWQRAKALGILKPKKYAVNWPRFVRPKLPWRVEPPPPEGAKNFHEIGPVGVECRAGYGDPRDLTTFRFCGQPTFMGRSWCASHAAIFWERR